MKMFQFHAADFRLLPVFLNASPWLQPRLAICNEQQLLVTLLTSLAFDVSACSLASSR